MADGRACLITRVADGRACLIARKKIAWKRDRQTDPQIHGHRDSMKESAKGRFFENVFWNEKPLLNPHIVIG